MNKTTMLFIRACKVNNNTKKRTTYARIASVYRRFYLFDPDNLKIALIHVLAEIVEEYNLITVTQLIARLDPNRVFGNPNAYNFQDQCLDSLINVIRHSSVDKFPGLISPTRFNKLDCYMILR